MRLPVRLQGVFLRELGATLIADQGFGARWGEKGERRVIRGMLAQTCAGTSSLRPPASCKPQDLCHGGFHVLHPPLPPCLTLRSQFLTQDSTTHSTVLLARKK